MRKLLAAFCLLSLCPGTFVTLAPAYGQSVPLSLTGDTAKCAAGNGTLLVATVIDNQGFFAGSGQLRGISLSHTRLDVAADPDGKPYQLAIDNIFASDYIQNARRSPASLLAIKPGDRLELCGVAYTNPAGIHYVHTNCGATPRPGQADGWVDEIDASGNTQSNLEASQTYCYLFN